LKRDLAGISGPRSVGAEPRVRDFSIAGYTGQIAAGFELPDLERAIARLIDPGAATKTLHWGRNYLYLTRCATAAGPLDVVVKQFRIVGLRDRLRRRLGGSKAAKSWRIAQAMAAAGVATPEPLLLIEARCSTGPSYYVCRYEAGVVEARYPLRAANTGRLGELFPAIDLPRFLHQLGAFVRSLHDAGFWHRDLSSGNILVRGLAVAATADGAARAAADESTDAVADESTAAVADESTDAVADGPYDFSLVDLNRARPGRRLSLSQRARDLSRLNVLRPEHRRLFLAGYWQREDGPPVLGRALYSCYFHAFLWKNEWKKRLRRGRPAGSPRRVGRVPHAHIPEAPAGAAARDQIVWDHLSDQPHQHAGRLSKLRVRLADASIHATTAATVARALPRVWRRYRELPRELFGGPVPWDGAGVCLRPWPEAPEALLALVEQLGTRHLLLRLHPWQDDHRAEEELAAELSRRGYDLTFALPQNRALVRDPARWRASLACLGERFTPYGRRFQIGQAINRSKWGVWNLRDYVELARGAEEVLRRHAGVELLGPAVIDFEYHLTIAVLNLPGAGFRFDAVSGLLYVDRSGPPEGRQLGFDAVDKVRLLRAIADTGSNCRNGDAGTAGPGVRAGQEGSARPAGHGRCWITEMNWPLWEGPHSPAGRNVSVDEDTQADYLVRYYLLTLGTGLVERVFWWQLVARGYGLVDPGGAEQGRCRPSFLALRTLLRELEGCRLEQVLPAPPPARLYRFRRPDGGDLVAGWSQVRRQGLLPRPAERVVGRDGGALPVPAGVEVELLPAPAYYHLVPD
jgi:tRNA A-37 threonylcarbamoyl transferase component Bud32